MIRRATSTVRFWLWYAAGTKGHLPRCRPLRLVAVSERTGDALRFGWRCAPGCPARARHDYRLLRRVLKQARAIQAATSDRKVA